LAAPLPPLSALLRTHGFPHGHEERDPSTANPKTPGPQYEA
jgi:hypothetical protein